MAIYEMTGDTIRSIPETTFTLEALKERGDLQRLLRSQIHVIAPETLIIAEEFGDWEESRRRIDLLGLDRDANLVVIELKRTTDGGHMELQAIRYAAMVSPMTFQQVINVYEDYLSKNDPDADAQGNVLEFLGWDEPDEDQFAQDVRIVLASSEFSKELTTAVLWLNDRGLDIRCIRLKPYNDNGRVLIDVQQVIPLPEAEELQIRIREKQQEERRARHASRAAPIKYTVEYDGKSITNLTKGLSAYYIVRHLCESGVKPEDISKLIPWRQKRVFLSMDGKLDSEQFKEKMSQEFASGRRNRKKRYWFCDDDELIYSNGRTYAFSKMWGKRFFEAMNLLISEYPEQGIKIYPSDSD